MPDYRVEIHDQDTGEWQPAGTVREFMPEPAPEPEPPVRLDWSWSQTLTRAAESARDFRDSMRKLSEQCRRGASEIRKLGQAVTRLGNAPRNYDPADDTWQTDLCAAWLCGSCPSPGYCDCTCHGGTRL